jgi:CRISPR-associated protein Cmr3
MPQAQSLNFPWPSTLAGLARTQAGRDANGRFDSGKIDALLAQEVAGPWLLELDENGHAVGSAFPAPRDLVAFSNENGGLDLQRLVPVAHRPGEGSSLPGALAALAFAGTPPKGKPSPGPAFWSWSDLETWLTEGRAPSRRFGVAALAHERRFHVGIDADTGTASDGKLFVSDGLRFWSVRPAGSDDVGRRLALGFATSDGLALKEGAVKLGGEGRVSYLRKGGGGLPACPASLLAGLERTRKARVLLATPAIFDNGALPKGGTLFGAKVLAMRVDRPEVTSGWDHAKDEPKPSRRMAPAGSVYWLDLSGTSDVKQWLAAAWGRPVQEQAEQDQRDGFGLALVGVGT